MDISKAAIEILRKAGTPLHAKELTKRMLAEGVWQTSGKTPEATVSARLYVDIKKHGKASPFVLAGPQTFALRETAGSPEPETPVVPAKPAAPQPSKRPAKGLSFLDAAEKVLEQLGQKRPMHYAEITRKALKLGWLETEGKTPDATMGALIYTTIKRAQRRGERSRFVQHGRGIFGLSKWMGEGLAYEVEQHNRQVRQALRKRLLGIPPKQFEELIGSLLVEMGFEDIDVTGRSGDGGIDVRATLVNGDVIRIAMAIQAKRWKLGNNVQSADVQRVRGSLGTHDQGLIITTSDFSSGARREAVRANAVPVGLVNGEQLVGLLVEHGIGISRTSQDIIDLEEVLPHDQ